MRKLKVLELFSGTGCVSKAFERHGHETYKVDWDERFDADLHIDVELLTAGMVLERFGRPDVVWLSPDCATFSLAAISRHRRKEDGILRPISEYARKCDRVDVNCMRLLRDLRPLVAWAENPLAGMRKAEWIQWAPRYTVSYCQYLQDVPFEQRRMKLTDIWTNVPNPPLKPPCKYGDPCHPRTPRGSKMGTQGLSPVERSMIPDELCEHVVEITEDYIERIDMANEYLRSQGREPITPRFDDPEPKGTLF